jgi:hypothetical protein
LIYGTWEQAHDTTREIVSEMGIPFTIVANAGGSAFSPLGRGMLNPSAGGTGLARSNPGKALI